jgi:hypothetical protein
LPRIRLSQEHIRHHVILDNNPGNAMAMNSTIRNSCHHAYLGVRKWSQELSIG